MRNVYIGVGLVVHALAKGATKCGIRLGLSPGHPFTETMAKVNCRRCLEAIAWRRQ